MGVRGLARYSYQQEAQTSRLVSPLTDVTLAVDFVGFQFFVCQEIAKQHDALPAATWLLLGGCPIRLEQYVEAWLTRLEAARIRLLFVSDPPQCFLGVGHTKTLELHDRAQQKLARLQELNTSLFEINTLESNAAVPTATTRLRTERKELAASLQDTQSCFPFSREKLRSVLKRHGATIVTATKEADEVLAQLVRDGKAYAVVANDSDFLVMRGVQYIPFHKLRVDDRRAGVVSARVFTPELLAASLEIQADQLVDLALLCTNDFTQQLDVEFGLAQALHFPRSSTNRSSADAITPELAARWILDQRLAILDDPRVRTLYTSYGAAFANTLGAFYSFYGYEAEFQQRFPMEMNTRRMPMKDMQRYKTLLDQYDYSSSLVDVLSSRTRRLKQQFDILTATSSVHPDKSMLALLTPVRRLLYQALDVPRVRESFYDPLWGHHKQQDLVAPSSASLQKFLASAPIANRPQLRVEHAWRSLVYQLLYDHEQGPENASFLWTLMGRQSASNVKSVVAALLLLHKCDAMHATRFVTMERLEILLLTSLVCVSMRENRVPPPYDLDEKDLAMEWQVYASVGAYLEILRLLHLMRTVLGEKVAPPNSSCPSLFSAEVFVPVYAIVQSTRPAPDATNGDADRALSRSQVDSVLCYYVADLQDDARTKKWDQFCQLRAVLHRLFELIPETAEVTDVAALPSYTTPMNSEVPVAGKPKLLVPSAILTSGPALQPATRQATKEGNTSTPSSSVASSGKKKNSKKKKKAATPRPKGARDAGKMVRSDDVTVVDPLNSSASVMAPPPLPEGPPPLPPLPPLDKKAARALKKQQAQAAPPRPASPTVVDESNGTKTQGTSRPASKPSLKPSLLAPAAVAKRFGKGAKKKNPSPRQQQQSMSNRGATIGGAGQPSTQSHEQSYEASSSLQGLLKRLPVYAHRHEILQNVASNQLTIIQGETGCGKSTSVPQFLLDDWLRTKSVNSRPVNIYVTQPRRIAAIELAKTVAQMREANEFGDDGILGNVVGYRIGQKHATSSKTKITYVTTGYMVERLIHDPEALKSMTHLVIDEVHERSMDVDSLLLLLKLQLKDHEHLRIVIMSATMDAKVLIKYFAKAMASKLVKSKPLFVGTKLFPVHNVYLENVAQVYPQLVHTHRNEIMRIHTELEKISSKRASANSELGQSIIQNVHEAQLRLIPALIEHLIVEHHHQNHQMPQCILVFLPGISGINRLYEELGGQFNESWHGIAVTISVLHSSLELEQQQVAFATIAGQSTKIVLATNLAESSVTIPDVTHVINCGMEKQIQMPNARSTHAEVLVDVWCSRASVLQRSGRAGRLMAGVAFHLFSQDFLEACMAEFTTPEILRKPLDRIVLQMKGKLHEFGVPSELLRQALDAPDLNHIDGAYKLLAHYDAIDCEDEDKAEITAFGSFVCHMPLNMELSRLLLMGKNLSGSGTHSQAYLLASVVVLVAILASPDLFLMPSWFHLQSPSKYMAEMKQNLKAKLAVDAGLWSEPLAMWRFYMTLLSEHSLTKRINVPGKLKKHSISMRRYQTLNLLISDTCERLLALARQGAIGLTASCMQMLYRLDSYASAQRVDQELLAFATSVLAQDQHDQDVLRFLVIHNYADRLITGRLAEGTHFDDDDDDVIAATDRIDLSLGKEDARTFFALSHTERKTILGQLAGSDDDFTNIAYSNNEVSLYSRALVASQPSGDATSPLGDGFDRLLPRLSLPVSLAYYIRDPKFPVDFGRITNDGKEEKLRFRVSDSSGSTLSWAQAKDGVRVSIGGRSLLSLPVRTPAANAPTNKLLAVYADRLFTGDETRMFCSKCTLLPPDAIAYQAVLLLATVRKNANVWIQVDALSHDIVAVKIDKQLVAMPAKTALRRDVVAMVNAVRDGFSQALQCTPEAGGEDAAGSPLLPVATIIDVCRDEQVVVRLTKEEARGRRYDWQQLTMALPTAAERTALRERGRTPPRFPQLG